MLRESTRAWSNGSEAYSSDPDEEEEDMIFGEADQDGVVDEMMDLSDLPTALFACNVHEAVFEVDADRVGSWSGGGGRLGSRFTALWLDVCLLNHRAECVIASRNESPVMSNKCMMSSAALAPDMHISMLPLFLVEFSLKVLQAFCHG